MGIFFSLDLMKYEDKFLNYKKHYYVGHRTLLNKCIIFFINRLRESDLGGRRAAKKELLTARNMIDRIGFAYQYAHWNNRDIHRRKNILQRRIRRYLGAPAQRKTI